MIILGFDTCLDKMYVTLACDNEILDSKIIKTTKEHYHSAFLISTIKNILSKNTFTPKEVNVIATNIGPGSFTGIRACTTVARVFAQGTGAKAIGISSLEILSKINGDKDQTLVALDARKEMAYAAIYKDGNEILPPKAISLEELKKLTNNNNYNIITDEKLQPILGGTAYTTNDSDLGRFLIEIANKKLNKNCETDWRKLLPLYIQPPPITIKKQNIHVGT